MPENISTNAELSTGT